MHQSRKRGIRQREGVPPLRIRQMPRLTTRIAADDPNRKSGATAPGAVRRELSREAQKQAVGEFRITAFLPFSTLWRLLQGECTRPDL